ncbi:hypothetical protein ACWEJ6_52110 [Nonomuraea sp. NPDC004702]
MNSGGDDGPLPSVEDLRQDNPSPDDLLTRTRAEDELILSEEWCRLTAARLRLSIAPCTPAADSDRQTGDL